MKNIGYLNFISLLTLLILTQSQSFGEPKADNTRVNKRESGQNRVTADQQTNNDHDIEITRQIRREVMRTSDLSTNAQNIKIITMDGKVTLKGPVHSMREENELLKVARNVAGKDMVINKMEIVHNY